jgi:hypothetical protein
VEPGEDKSLMSKPENYLFHSYDLAGTTSYTNARFLFNSAKYLQLQSAKNWRVYEMLAEDTRAVNMRIAFHVEAGEALSPLRAPFGFLEIYKNVNENEVKAFFSLLETDLISRGIKIIRVKSYPSVYDKNFDTAAGALKILHYTNTQEISSIIPVNRKSFDKKIKISERQKLRKAEKLFSFEEVTQRRIKDIYTFIKACRDERGQNLSMSFSDVKKTMTNFSDNYFLYRVYGEEGTAAAAIVIKVSEDILYTFYYAHDRKFDKVSPVVLLISAIYKKAHQEGMTLIDLGTSMVNGRINRSLLHFKESIGGQPHPKFIFEKNVV